MIKKNHHYVWQHYLRQWKVGSIVCHNTKNGKIGETGEKGLAVEKHFYSIPILSFDEIDFIKKYITSIEDRLSVPELTNLIRHEFSFIIECLKDIAKRRGNHALRKISEEKLIDLLENKHSNIENLAKPIFDRLIKGEFFCLDNLNNFFKFLTLLSQQYMRTNQIEGRMQDMFAEFDDSKDYSKLISNTRAIIQYLAIYELAAELSRREEIIICSLRTIVIYRLLQAIDL